MYKHALQIEAIAAFADNYIWCLHECEDAWLVDPGDAAPVLAFLASRKLTLRGILITHHHADHVGGIGALRTAYPQVVVHGPRNPAIDGIDHTLREGDGVSVFGHRFEVIEVPGHTLDHIAFYAADTAPPTLFCGDTLFAAGCGRLFEGTAPQMYASLQKLARLPAETAVYCAHEYTLSNLRFASAVEPCNAPLRTRGEHADALRARQLPTLPSEIGLELATNPFLRCQAPAVVAAARQRLVQAGQPPLQDENPAAIFAVIRGWKDRF